MVNVNWKPVIYLLLAVVNADHLDQFVKEHYNLESVSELADEGILFRRAVYLYALCVYMLRYHIPKAHNVTPISPVAI